MSIYEILAEPSPVTTTEEVIASDAFDIKSIESKMPELTQSVEPLLEIQRGKLYSYLVKTFITSCVDIFGVNIFSIKKSVSRTITNLLSSWLFSLYVDYDYYGDYFFPTNYENTQSLEATLRDYCSYDKTITEVDEKITKLMDILKTKYKQLLISLEEYKKREDYKKFKYSIKKSYKYCGKKIFIKLELVFNLKIFDKKLNNILNNIIILENVYDKLFCSYTNKLQPKLFDAYVWAILFRYQLLGSNNHQLAVQPRIFESMEKDYGLNFECFASAINSVSKAYCSIYWDLERYFGSVGNFFKLDFKYGTFGFNPPYQINVMDLGIKKLLKHLDEATGPLTFFITIPIWDKEGRKTMEELYPEDYLKPKLEYEDFTIVNEIKISKYYRGVKMTPKEKFTYLDHNFELYKNKTIQNTYVFVISNKDIDLSNFMKYNFE